jgi:hypothetical protein
MHRNVVRGQPPCDHPDGGGSWERTAPGAPPPRADPTSARARWIAAAQKAAQSDDATLEAAAASAMDEFRRRFNVK